MNKDRHSGTSLLLDRTNTNQKKKLDQDAAQAKPSQSDVIALIKNKGQPEKETIHVTSSQCRVVYITLLVEK